MFDEDMVTIEMDDDNALMVFDELGQPIGKPEKLEFDRYHTVVRVFVDFEWLSVTYPSDAETFWSQVADARDFVDGLAAQGLEVQ